MKNPTDPGINRTGIDFSPIDSKDIIAEAERTPPSSPGNVQALLLERNSFLQQAIPIGTVPIPGTLKGMAKATLQKLALRKPEVLIDKLAERLAFERAGARLYEALINKCEARTTGIASLPIANFRRIRDEEHRHFLLVVDCVRRLGADPTAITPCADVVAVESLGLIQTVTDPRTSIAQSLHAILVAELTDRDGWENLILIAKAMNQVEMVESFSEALATESEHLATIRQLYADLSLLDAQAVAEAA